MKLGRKTITLLAFALGTLVFVSTALADMALGSGYDLLKQVAKETTAQMEGELDNFTLETLLTFKVDDKTVYQTSLLSKYDMKQKARVEESVEQRANGETSSYYSYADPHTTIFKGDDEVYYVTEYEDGQRGDDWKVFENPFAIDGAAEVEKIVDALVGNLKDQVQVEEKPDGGRLYSGQLNEMQVPALINAVSSFAVKQMAHDRYYWNATSKIPQIESDVYIKKVTGQAVETDEGRLESITGEAVLLGKDKDGREHELILNAVIKVTDVGTTKVAKPDLTNAKVERGSHDYFRGLTQKHVGTYKNDIIIEKEGQFVKIGERIVVIDRVEGEKITGQYKEMIKPEYAELYPDPLAFTFEVDPVANEPLDFSYINRQGKKRYGQIFPSSPGRIYFEMEMELLNDHSIRSDLPIDYDSQFTRVFDE